MSIRLTGYIKSFGNAGFIAGVNELKGMIEQANSPQGAIEKLILAIRIRTAFDQKANIDGISVVVEPQNPSAEKNAYKNPQKELNLLLQS